MDNPRLFAIYVGGKTATSHVEVHDMRFCVGAALEDCFPALRREWWGTPRSLHVDAWAELTHADGFDIALRADPPSGEARLYFVNLGGYDMAEFTELHRNVFVVAQSEASAKLRALKQIRHWKAPHKDHVMEVEHAVDLSGLTAESGLHVHLTQAALERPFAFTCKYLPLARGA